MFSLHELPRRQAAMGDFYQKNVSGKFGEIAYVISTKLGERFQTFIDRGIIKVPGTQNMRSTDVKHPVQHYKTF
jgi:hypothetical protein